MRHWTEEERQKQSKLIHSWQPWKNSTGAKTEEGKEASKMNAYKYGVYSEEMKELKKELNKQCKIVGI